MKARSMVGLLVLSGTVLLPAGGWSRARQDNADKDAGTRTLAGCLSRGEKEGEYNLRAEDGSTWEIQSKTVKLSDHVGHMVRLTGKVWHADLHGAKEKTKEAVDPDAKEHGHLRVTDLEMVSESCKR